MSTNDDLRKDFWKRSLDDADDFMNRMKTYPVEDSCEPMVPLSNVASSENIEVIFSDTVHHNNLPRLYYLRKGLIPSFIALAKDFNEAGMVLKIEDCYRTKQMQSLGICNDEIFLAILRKVQWECGCDVPPIDLLFRRIGALVAMYPKVGTHMSGSAMDMSVVNRDTGETINRGAPYLEMSELTPMDSPFVCAEGQENRAMITQLMIKHGFVAYPFEFWHYSAEDAYAEYLGSGKPAKYGAVYLDLVTGDVLPIENPTQPIASKDFVLERVKQLISFD